MEIWVSILSASIGIVTVLVGVVTIIFGYNILSYKKKLNKIVRSNEEKCAAMFLALKSEVNERLDKSMDDVIRAVSICNDISCFIDKNIKSGLMKHYDGLMNMAHSLEIAKKVSNPYLSAYLLGELTKIFFFTTKEEGILELKINNIIDYRRLIMEGIDANISIIENSGINGLIEKNDTTGAYYVKEYATSFINLIKSITPE